MASTRICGAEILCHIFSDVLYGEKWTAPRSQREFVRLGLWSQSTWNISFDEIPDLQLLLRSKQFGQLTFLSRRYLWTSYFSSFAHEILRKLHKYVPKVHTLILDGVCRSPREDIPQFPMSWLSSVENLKLTSGIVSFDGLANARILLNDFTHLRKLKSIPKTFNYLGSRSCH